MVCGSSEHLGSVRRECARDDWPSVPLERPKEPTACAVKEPYGSVLGGGEHLRSVGRERTRADRIGVIGVATKYRAKVAGRAVPELKTGCLGRRREYHRTIWRERTRSDLSVALNCLNCPKEPATRAIP